MTTPTLEQQIDSAYRATLKRGADPAGLKTYSDLIRAGQLDLGGLHRLLVESDECRERRAHPENRDALNDLVVEATGGVVQAGPFAGVRLLIESARGDGDVAPKLLGTYEQELHPAIGRFAGNTYDAIVDVGCAEGYYAIGLAKLFPATPILAYDTDGEALDILARTAHANDCVDQIVPGDFCDSITLNEVFERYGRTLVIADCEGYEKTLFADRATNAAGAASDFIIECHDLWDATITPTITEALADTHDITTVIAGGRNPNVYPFLAHLSDWDRWRAVWERRGARQHWLICEPRKG